MGILKIPTGFFSHIFKWDFFPTGKIRKNKMCVLSRQSLLSAMHIAEKNLYGSIHRFNFSHGIFFPFCNMGKKSHGIFRFFKIAYFWKIIYEINSVDIYFYQNKEILLIFQYLYFPVGNFSHGNFFPFCNMGKNSHGIFRFFKIANFWKKYEWNKFSGHIIIPL